jgi:hypothetical protein
MKMFIETWVSEWLEAVSLDEGEAVSSYLSNRWSPEELFNSPIECLSQAKLSIFRDSIQEMESIGLAAFCNSSTC